MPKILVYSTFYGLPSFTKESIKNHLFYCLKHGYDYIPEIGEKPTWRQFSWAKILLGIKHLKSNRYDAIFWMDADSWFLNDTIKLEYFLDNHQEPIQFSGDENDIFNGGHFLLKNNDLSIKWLEDCWQICETKDDHFITTHKDQFHLFDQPGILAVLGGAKPKEPNTWASGFNAINGFPGNNLRAHKNFKEFFSPMDPHNCEAARSLICQEWRPHCIVHPQRAMNSYPWHMNWDDFIIHFVGNTKHLMQEWHGKFNFYPKQKS